ncbi:Pyridoxamine 5'-phosphate oxidase [Streptomyces sp. YIM 130001]|uniref:pyridoxamine 5'-phosphate oxidase family protein n=1 Tax=Streptomyces sp. YIM 130001 TaxID=2259644 RepID=UPI000EE217F1|nr:pyridoxamine 5'-phosphate oxidase family protein [Streptomyces sp. YIM 130001]RII12403.1 Pyridoxamine 5'-phosphate oxidase [Streptomyces sp. YIM 130001]
MDADAVTSEGGDTGMDVHEFLAQPLVARVAAAGPSVRPVWYLWEEGAFWWLTGSYSRLGRILESAPRVALVVDVCEPAAGRVLSVTCRGAAQVVPLERARAERKLGRYLGPRSRWPARFTAALDDPATRMVRLEPASPPKLRDLSW